MNELTDLRGFFTMQFNALDHICKSPTTWIFLCLSAFIDYLSNIPDLQPKSRHHYSDFIIQKYPAAYHNFQYQNGKRDLPNQMYVILRNGLVHRFSLTPDARGLRDGGRQRSLYLAHKTSGNSHLSSYVDTVNDIDAAVLIAEDLLADTKVVVENILQRAESNSILKQKIISFIISTPPVSGVEQNYFWR